MSEGEQKLLDTQGKFLKVVQNGQKLNDASWIPGRVILSNKRVLVVAEDGKLTIPLSDIRSIGGRYDVNQAVAGVSQYVSLEHDDDVVLVTLDDKDRFKWTLYDALLNGEIVLVNHPAVEGGVVQDVAWEKARVTIDARTVMLGAASGKFIEVNLDDVGGVTADERTVSGSPRPVIEVEHAEGSTSVETHLAGTDRLADLLESIFKEGARQNQAEIDLDGPEEQVLMALYSGVSPFEIPAFVDLEVDKVEEIYERLIELDVLDEVRTRREVALTTRGRNLASESINDQ